MPEQFTLAGSKLDFARFNSIYMVREPVDLRKGIDGYATMIQSVFKLDPFDESLFLFTNRSRNKLKAIYYSGTGFWLLYDRLAKGSFKWIISGSDPCHAISKEQFTRLLEGKTPEPQKGFSKTRPRYI